MVAVHIGRQPNAGVSGNIDHDVTHTGGRRRPVEVVRRRPGANGVVEALQALLDVLQRFIGGAGLVSGSAIVDLLENKKVGL